LFAECSHFVNMSCLAICLKSVAHLFFGCSIERESRLDFESGQSDVYNMFESVVDVVHGKKKKLLFVKCMDCGRFSSFRPKSKGIQFTVLYCNHCGRQVSLGAQGIDRPISEDAEIFCENCIDDCRKCQISKLVNEQSRQRSR